MGALYQHKCTIQKIKPDILLNALDFYSQLGHCTFFCILIINLSLSPSFSFFYLKRKLLLVVTPTFVLAHIESVREFPNKILLLISVYKMSLITNDYTEICLLKFIQIFSKNVLDFGLIVFSIYLARRCNMQTDVCKNNRDFNSYLIEFHLIKC